MEEMYVHELCRLCLYKSENLFDIFGVDGRHGYLAAEVIQDLLQIEVRRFDGFPRCVCCICLDKLTDFKLFKDQCMESRLSFEQVMALPKKQGPSGGHQDVHQDPLVCSSSIKAETDEEAEVVEIPVDDDSVPQVSLAMEASPAPSKPSPLDVVTVDEDDDVICPESNAELGSLHKDNRMRNSKGRFMKGTSVGRSTVKEKSARIGELTGETVNSTMEEISTTSNASKSSLTLKELLQESPSMPDAGGASSAVLRREGIVPVEDTQRQTENPLRSDGPTSSLGRENLRPRTGTPQKRQRATISPKVCVEKRPKLMRGCESRSPVIPDITLSRINIPDSHGTEGQGTDVLVRQASPTVRTAVGSPVALKPKDTHHTSLDEVPCWKQPRRIAASAHMYTEGSILLSSGNTPQGFVDWSCLGSEPRRKKKQRQKSKQNSPTKATAGLNTSTQAPSAQDGVGAGEPKLPLQCSTCGRWFQSHKSYLQHRKTHVTQEPSAKNTCPQCQKIFTTNQSMKRHQLTHSELRPFACNLCKNGYKRIDYLKRHIEIHHKAQGLAVD